MTEENFSSQQWCHKKFDQRVLFASFHESQAKCENPDGDTQKSGG
jgi:hypothetical protein